MYATFKCTIKHYEYYFLFEVSEVEDNWMIVLAIALTRLGT